MDVTDGANDFASLILRASTLIRLSRAEEALACAERARERADSEDDTIIASVIAARASLRLGDRDGAERWLAGPAPTSPFARSEHGYARTMLAYARGDYDVAESALMDARAYGNPDTQARAMGLEAHVASARGDFARHAELLVAALAIPGQQDVYTRANLIFQISCVARETAQPIDIGALESAFTALAWTEHVRLWKFLSGQNLAWYHALDGSYLRAYRYAERAIEDAPSEAWSASTEADYAQFALAAGEYVTAAVHLDRALRIIGATDWSALGGEERSVFFDVAILLAEGSSGEAAEMLRELEAMPPLSPLFAFAHGDRMRAELDYAYGIQSPGDAEQVARLISAHETFARLGHTWRAAATSAALARITGKPEWLEAAKRELAAYPRSWIARDLAERFRLRERYPELTPQQLRVVELLHAGASDREIATALGCTHKTARNHVGAVLTKLGVSNRRFLFDANRLL